VGQYWLKTAPITAINPCDLKGVQCVQRCEIDIDEVKRLLGLRVPKTVIAEMQGVSRRTLGRYIKEYKQYLYPEDSPQMKAGCESDAPVTKTETPAKIQPLPPSLPAQDEAKPLESDTNKNHQVLQNALKAFDQS
jgi:hypothetical protein